jgi:hypothetical protein
MTAWDRLARGVALCRSTPPALGLTAISCALAGVIALLFAPVVHAAGPVWRITTESRPTVLAPGGEGQIHVAVNNFGDVEANGEQEPVILSARLPAGVTPTAISGFAGVGLHFGEETFGIRGPLECTLATLTCEFRGQLPPFERLEAVIDVRLAQGSSGTPTMEADAQGGRAAPVTSSVRVPIDEAPTSFGVAAYELLPTNELGNLDTSAGSHPFQLTSVLSMNSGADPLEPPALVKDLGFSLPPGLVGNLTGFPRCSDEQFSAFEEGINRCPSNSAIGVAQVTIDEPIHFGLVTLPVPVFNLVPRRGEPARFGFDVLNVPGILDTSLRTGGDYGVTIRSRNITETAVLVAANVTIWGVPGDPRHDRSRGWQCVYPFVEGSCEADHDVPGNAVLSLPTSCSQAFVSTVTADSWRQPAFTRSREFALRDETGAPLTLSGCEQLDFEPSMSVRPDGHASSSPTGVSVEVHVPQATTLAPTGRAEADVRRVSVALPEGVEINPAGADGLEGCSIAEVGFVSLAGGRADFAESGACSNSAKIGEVEEITTPLPRAAADRRHLPRRAECEPVRIARVDLPVG